MVIDTNKEIRRAVDTGKTTMGVRESEKNILNGKSKLILMSENIPADVFERIESLCTTSEIALYKYKGTSISLGAVCGKPFPIAVMSIEDTGKSKVLELLKWPFSDNVDNMKISNEEILYINALSNASHVTAKDCIIENKVICFLVNGKDLGKAIGKNAHVVKNLSFKLKKNVEIFGYYKEVKEFIKKAFNNVKIEGIELKEKDESKEVLISVDFENKRKILSNRKRMDRIKKILERNYKVTGVRIK